MIYKLLTIKNHYNNKYELYSDNNKEYCFMPIFEKVY